MAKKREQVIAGINIYKDDLGRDILYDKRHSLGYYIPKSEAKNYTLYHNRYYLVIIGVILLLNFNINWMIVLGAGIVGVIVLEYRYRMVWLPSLNQITNFHPKNKVSTIQGKINEGDKGRLILLAILYLAFGILMVINSYQIKASLPIVIANYVILAACIYMCVINIIAFTRIKK